MGYGSILSRSRKASSFYPTIRIIGVTGDKIPTIQKGKAVAISEAVGSNYIAKPWAFGEYEVKVDGITIAKVKVTQLIEYGVAAPSSTLNNNSWEVIRLIADQGAGANYWNVGDAKSIVLNGTVQGYTFSNLTINAFIIGINHNAELEGANNIHFQIGKIGSIAVALCDNNYGNNGSSNGFRMNLSNTNVGGWERSYGRNTLLGNSNTPISPFANSLVAALPSDLRTVIKSVTKYTDNTGNSNNTPDAVTATIDYLFFLAEFEVRGVRTYANQYEQNYQTQYDYYKAGNSKIKYRHNATSTAVWYWCRSPYYNDNVDFCGIFPSGDGGASSDNANDSRGLAPALVV